MSPEINIERYREYLKSESWKKKKRLVLKRDNCICQGCGAKETTLEVHHLTYERVGSELLLDLVSLCVSCHEKIHNRAKPEDWNKYIINKNQNKPKESFELTDDEKLLMLIEEI